jgi:hypothetical protein
VSDESSSLRMGTWRLDVVGFANCGDLFEVVSAVKKLEHPPILDAEGAEDGVTGTPGVAEERFGFPAEGVETYEVFVCSPCEFIAG